ncbi:BrnT family toxin [Methylotuvimicrobium sp.]|uniref:BrnT family toxin n=1 Tax=Methylotuvimicrobium sp. TaxID=2822413 RepID=UPI003D655F93
MHSRLLVVCHCIRDGEVIRIISARKANRRERKTYEGYRTCVIITTFPTPLKIHMPRSSRSRLRSGWMKIRWRSSRILRRKKTYRIRALSTSICVTAPSHIRILRLSGSELLTIGFCRTDNSSGQKTAFIFACRRAGHYVLKNEKNRYSKKICHVTAESYRINYRRRLLARRAN